jgi:hypothetical protein
MLLDMWGAVSAQWWADRQAAVGLTGQVADEAPVGIMVSEGGEQAPPRPRGGGPPVSAQWWAERQAAVGLAGMVVAD